jgi:DNA polymerase-3 subunit alpha
MAEVGRQRRVEGKVAEVDFRSGLLKKGWTNEQLIEIWQLMLKQAEYCFNRGHAVAYGLLSYLTAYLKTHYTIYFMTALLSSKSDKVEKISVVINDCNRLGIKVSPPNVNKSNSSFTSISDNNEILFGLLAVKGLGESIVNKIIELRPYKNFKDFSDKISDKLAIITLVKAGAIPTKDKMITLKRYADNLFERKEFTPVTTIPSPYSKLIQFGLNVDNYKIDKRKVDKERLLCDYNNIKKRLYLSEQEEKYKNHMITFQQKYAQDEYMWEFDTLSMFLTNDPLKDAYKFTDTEWDLVEDGEKTTLFCVIIDIKRKKDKNGNQFAYIDLYTPFGIIEGTIWSSQLKEYSDLIKKGKCLAILGRKRDNHFFVEKVKLYNTWLDQQRKKGVKI